MKNALTASLETLVLVAVMVWTAILAVILWLLKPLAPDLAALLARNWARHTERWAMGLLGMVALFAAENLKSTLVTNADATPVDLSDARLSHGRVREMVAIIEAAGGDAGSTYRFVRVWSGWRISGVYFASDDLNTNATVDIGVYQTAENGGAVVDADFFASAVNVTSAAVAETNVTHESGAFDIDDSEKPLWQALGLTEDSKRWYDIGAISATSAITGTMKLRVQYVDGT